MRMYEYIEPVPGEKTMKPLLDLLKETCTFKFYKGGRLYYITDDSRFEFYVPTDELEGAMCSASERCMTLMRWLRPQYQAIMSATGVL